MVIRAVPVHPNLGSTQKPMNDMRIPAGLKPSSNSTAFLSRTIPKTGVGAVEVFFGSPAPC